MQCQGERSQARSVLALLGTKVQILTPKTQAALRQLQEKLEDARTEVLGLLALLLQK